MIGFFETPLGKRFLEVSPQIMQESMMIGQKYGAEIGREVGKLIAEEVAPVELVDSIWLTELE